MRPGSNVLAIFMLFGAVWFTLFAVIAWLRMKRVAAMVLAIVAGLDIAMAIQFLSRYYNH